MENKDPLSALVSNDAKAIDRQKLAELLTPYTVIDQESMDFGFTSAFDEIDGVLPAEIIATGIMAEGSVKTSLKRLYDSRKIKKTKDGRYFIPAYHIAELAKRLISK